MSLTRKPHRDADPHLVAALELHERGMPVVPLIRGYAHPAIEKWANVPLPNTAAVHKMFCRGRHNPGLIGGLSGSVFVLSVSNMDGEIGQKSLSDLESKFGELPDTWNCAQIEHFDGGFRRHYWFKVMDGLGVLSVENLVAGIHVVGIGRYIPAPPSIVDGLQFNWLTHDRRIGPAAPPDWLLNLLGERNALRSRG